MKGLLVACVIALASNANALGTYLGTDLQDVNVTGQSGQLLIGSTETLKAQLQAGSNAIGTVGVTTLPSIPAGSNAIGTVGVTTLPSIPAGANAIGTVGVTALPALSAGSNQIGTVSGSTVTSILKDSGGNEVGVTNNRLNVNATVEASTQALKGKNGNTITSQTIGSNEALHVVNLGAPDLSGKAAVYKSSDAMVVSGTLVLTGLAKSIDIQAVAGDCTFSVNGGDNINVLKNSAESYDFAYTLTNPSVLLVAKAGGATCKARIIGAN